MFASITEKSVASFVKMKKNVADKYLGLQNHIPWGNRLEIQILVTFG